MVGIVCVGAQWGDEGKGKIVDILSEHANMIVRYQGGNNAGHTLIVNGKTTILHLIPSGILYGDKICVIANGVVVDPLALLTEIKGLEADGYEVNPYNLRVSDQAHVIVELHKIIDKAREQYLPKKIGTTGRGIGPAYEDKVARRGIRMMDLLRDNWPEVLKERIEGANKYLENLGAPLISEQQAADMLTETLKAAAFLRPFIVDTVELIATTLKNGRKVIFEGAQGTLLDVDHGTYPYVTSSNTIAGAVCTGCGIGPSFISQVMGVTKAYSTRVGEGPFPTELLGAEGEHFRTLGKEFGATTGRPRRCGWLDLVALRRAVTVNGIRTLAITKLDILDSFESIKVAYAYKYKNNVLETYPTDTEVLRQVIPLYKTLPGWCIPTSRARKLEALPEAAKNYVKYINDALGTNLTIVSVGPDRGSEIMISNRDQILP